MLSGTPGEMIFRIVMTIVPMILSLTVHEYAHARVAYRLGDDTALRLGRMTLNPASHIDPIGTLLIPIIVVLTGAQGLIGWARPVPVNPTRFRRDVNMRAGMALTAAAGPLANVVLAVLSAAGLWLVFRFVSSEPATAVGAMRFARPGTRLLWTMMELNVSLAVFNLLPIPPLDGSRLLPRQFDGFVQTAGQFSFLLIMVVLSNRHTRVIIEVPIQACLRLLVTAFQLPA